MAFKPVLYFDDTAKRILGTSTMKIARTTISLKNSISSFFNSPHLQKQVEELTYEIRKNKVELALEQNQAEENKRLKELIGAISLKEYKLTTCDLWFRDPKNPMNFTINKGSKDQLKIEQGIVYPFFLSDKKTIQYQLLGRIQELNLHSSRVLSILDQRSKISSRNLRTLALGNVMFDEKRKVLYVMTMTENDDYALNDIIVTSELSSLPKNIIIGIVQSIEPTTTINKKIILGTSIDFLKVTMAAAIQ